MKKVIGIALVVFFLFSLLPATAGPAYKKLKLCTKPIITISEYPKDSLMLKFFNRDIIKYTRELEMNREKYPMGLGYSLSYKHNVWRAVIRPASSIFCDDSFQETIRKHPKLFQYKIYSFTMSVLDEPWESFKKLLRQDLRSKGLSDQEITELTGF